MQPGWSGGLGEIDSEWKIRFEEIGKARGRITRLAIRQLKPKRTWHTKSPAVQIAWITSRPEKI
jgi:hypothetical protein